MAPYKTPDVYIEEISLFPPSVAEVETAIPAFIGYTQKADKLGPNDLLNVPTRVTSLLEYERLFGGAPEVAVNAVTLDDNNRVSSYDIEANFYLYDSLRLFFKNGGGKCYIISIGTYGTVRKSDFETGLDKLKKQDEPTIIVFPDAVKLGTGIYDIQKKALEQCSELKDRVVICDLPEAGGWQQGIDDFRDNIGMNFLKYGAAYTPWLQSNLGVSIHYRDIQGKIKDTDGNSITLDTLTTDANIQKIITDLDAAIAAEDTVKENIFENSLFESYPVYRNIIDRLSTSSALTSIPPSGAIAGIYALVDSSRGVWKAPANVSLAGVVGVTEFIDSKEQEELNVDVVAGKSINAIRPFTGKGIMVWGARTLAGNDNEWRYVPVRRFFNMVEESIKKSTYWAVFEPNDANTWIKVKSMIENFLVQKWREGALAGAKPDEAFFVKVGLGVTMTAQDILEGRMNVEIGMAVVRPAEFIVLKFSHKMQQS